MVSSLAAKNDVVTFAAVRGYANCRQSLWRHIMEQCARIDDIVSSIGVRIGQRENPPVVLVLSSGKPRERIERFLSEIHTQYVIRMAAVPDTVLRRIAVDDERGIWAGATGDRDMVAADLDTAIKGFIEPEYGEFHSGLRRQCHILQGHHGS